MDPEDILPYEGDLRVALEKGDNRAAQEILSFRDRDDISFSLPRLGDAQEICEVEITFLNDIGLPDNSLCGKVDKLNMNLSTSNRYFAIKIPLKKLLDDTYILEDDGKLISKFKKLIGIPICKDAYSLVEKEDYDKNFGNVYYSLYARLYWKLKNRSSDIPYANFQGHPEREMLAQIQDLVKSHKERNRVLEEDIEAEVDDPAELEQILYIPEKLI